MTTELRRAKPLADFYQRVIAEHEPSGRADNWVQAADNLVTFLRRFPYLVQTSGWRIIDGSGIMHPEFNFPCLDHAYTWRRIGRKRRVVALTAFPYNVDQERMQAHADRYGFVVEIAPSDVPDLWYPGWTVPVVWSRRGEDWRALT